MTCIPCSRLWSLSISALVLLGLQGCLSYREQGEMRADGSGRITVAMGAPSGSYNPEKAAEVLGTVKRLRGLAWVEGVDSSSQGRRWRGGTVEFDSARSLRPLNSTLPLENLFGGIQRIDSGNVCILTRTLKIPSSSNSQSRETFDIEWKVPGRILSTDRHAKWDEGSDVVRWRFVADESGDKTARLTVRWSVPVWSRSIASTPTDRRIAPWMLGLAIANLVLALIAIPVAQAARSRARKQASSRSNPPG